MSAQIRRLAFYGKGGIGKSTVCSNLAVALSEIGEKVVQIGCSPKIDSTSFLLGGIHPMNITDELRAKGKSKAVVAECFVEGARGVICAECGGPEPFVGCAGKGVKTALDLTNEYHIIDDLAPTFVLYDVIGDVVCGGFAQPMRSGFAEEVYIVSSGEAMSLYAANNICMAIQSAIEEGASVRVGGFIANMRGVPNEEEVLGIFGTRLNVPVLAKVPRDGVVQEAEGEGGVVVEKRPESALAQIYRDLARRVIENRDLRVPTPITIEEIISMLREYQLVDVA